MAELAVIATIAGTGLQAYSQIMMGKEQSKAAQFEAQQLKIQQENTRIAAMQNEAMRREELTSSLETLQALRSGRGVGAFTPGGMAIFDKITSDQESNIRTENLTARQKADREGMEANMALSKGKTSLLAGYLGAGSTIASGVTQAYRYNRYQV